MRYYTLSHPSVEGASNLSNLRSRVKIFDKLRDSMGQTIMTWKNALEGGGVSSRNGGTL